MMKGRAAEFAESDLQVIPRSRIYLTYFIKYDHIEGFEPSRRTVGSIGVSNDSEGGVDCLHDEVFICRRRSLYMLISSPMGSCYQNATSFSEGISGSCNDHFGLPSARTSGDSQNMRRVVCGIFD